jgi:intracellular sulfur oxidation DsrE/DsrF family protein
MRKHVALAAMTAACLVIGADVVGAQSTSDAPRSVEPYQTRDWWGAPTADQAGGSAEPYQTRGWWGEPTTDQRDSRAKRHQAAVTRRKPTVVQAGGNAERNQAPTRHKPTAGHAGQAERHQARRTSGKATVSASATRKQKQQKQAAARRKLRSAAVTLPAPAAQKTEHRLAVQVNANDPAAMNLVLNNVQNFADYHQGRGEPVEIEVVAYGPGLHMLRDDTSQVKDRIRSMSAAMPNVTFIACANTLLNMKKTEAKDVPLISQAKLVDSGVVRLVELQEKGWSYIRP